MTSLSTVMHATIVGHVTADPASHGSTEPSGRVRHRCEFTVVVSRTDRDPVSGEREAHPTFLVVRCKGDTLARNALSQVRRGDLVLATGFLDQVERRGPGGRSTQVILVAKEIGLALSKPLNDEDGA